MHSYPQAYFIVLITVTSLITHPPTSSANFCQADINGDGRVTAKDLAIMRAEIGRDDCATIPCRADVNGDGSVNDKDMLILRSEFNRNCLSDERDMPESEEDAFITELDRGFDSSVDGEAVQEEAVLSDAQQGEELDKETATLTSRFKDNGDGTVTDPETNLMWTTDANLAGDTLRFHQALNYIKEMNRGDYPNYGYTDWRRPTLKELRSLIDYTNHTTSGHMPPQGHPFQNVQSLRLGYPWLSTYFSTTGYTSFFSLYCRLVGHNAVSCHGYLWPVRGGGQVNALTY